MWAAPSPTYLFFATLLPAPTLYVTIARTGADGCVSQAYADRIGMTRGPRSGHVSSLALLPAAPLIALT